MNILFVLFVRWVQITMHIMYKKKKMHRTPIMILAINDSYETVRQRGFDGPIASNIARYSSTVECS